MAGGRGSHWHHRWERLGLKGRWSRLGETGPWVLQLAGDAARTRLGAGEGGGRAGPHLHLKQRASRAGTAPSHWRKPLERWGMQGQPVPQKKPSEEVAPPLKRRRQPPAASDGV